MGTYLNRMKTGTPLYRLVLLFIIFTSCDRQLQHQGNDERPNIIVIMADDMGYSDLGCMGSEIPTPNIDHLASQGILMTHFYNAARCCPTRASLLTGLYPHQAGMGDMVEGRLLPDSSFLPSYQGWLGNDCVTLAEVLKMGGHETFISGKWHVGNALEHWPDRRGFDRSFALIHGASNYFNLDPWIRKGQPIILSLDGENYTPGPDFYMTEAFTDHAIRFIEERNMDHPFFLYLAYTAPHWPLQALEEDIKRFEGAYEEGWTVLRQQRFQGLREKGIIGEDTDLTPAFFQSPMLTPAWDTLSEAARVDWQRRMEVYAAMMYRMDLGIGKVLKKLEKSGSLDNTLILFLSDNGATQASIHLATSWYADRSGPIGSAKSFDSQGPRWANANNTPFKLFKSWTTEGGIATPFIACWPKGLESGRIVDTPGHIIDLMPTLIHLAGVDYPEKYGGQDIQAMEGIDLLPTCRGEGKDNSRMLFWEHHGHWAVRKGDYKLLFTKRAPGIPQDGQLELFDLGEDRSESMDIKDQYPAMVDELSDAYESWAERVGVYPWDSLILASDL